MSCTALVVLLTCLEIRGSWSSDSTGGPPWRKLKKDWLDDVEDTISDAPEEFETAGEEAMKELGTDAAATALQTSGVCHEVYHGFIQALPWYAQMLATRYQSEATSPALNQKSCIDTTWREVKAIFDRQLDDPTGLVVKAAAGIAPEVGPQVCCSKVMSALKTHEGIRKVDPDTYRMQLGATLREVFQAPWVKGEVDKFCDHEGERLRLFERDGFTSNLESTHYYLLGACFFIACGIATVAVLLVRRARRAGQRTYTAAQAGDDVALELAE